MTEIEFILYVENQNKSKEFYQNLLQINPSLDVFGMTEFKLADNVKLGLMPEKGIAKILYRKMPHPNKGNGIPRCELYLKVNNIEEYLKRSIKLGGKIISKLQDRN